MICDLTHDVRWDDGGQLKRRHHGNHSRKSTLIRQKSIEDVFIRTLVAASTCRPCASADSALKALSSRQRVASSIKKCQLHTAGRARAETTVLATSDDSRERRNHVTRKQYSDLVNTYKISDLKSSVIPAIGKTQVTPKTLANYYPLAPRLVLTPEQEDRPPDTAHLNLPPEDDAHAAAIERLRKVLRRKREEVSPARIWECYQSLPTPRLRYLPDHIIRKMFRRLGFVEFRDLASSKCYFNLLDECLEQGVGVTVPEWNTALAFAGRWVRDVSTAGVKKAVEMWLRMEKAGAQASNVTFNILFDVAVRAQRFALADTICLELQRRELPLNRYFRTSMIFYAGMRRDGDAVRKAFRDLVNAGEIVDTAVMNCVLLSLARAGETASVEHVFEKMKELHTTKFGAPPSTNWIERMTLGSRLNNAAVHLREEREKHESTFFGGVFSADARKEEVQKNAPIGPDIKTYRILFLQHVYTTRDLDKIRQLVREMHDDGWRMPGSLYGHLFRGFVLHGGHAHTEWSRTSLESWWQNFVAADAEGRAETARCAAETDSADPADSQSGPFDPSLSDRLEDPQDGPTLDSLTRPLSLRPALVGPALEAFYKCAGRVKMLQVWEEVRHRWPEMSKEDQVALQSTVDRLAGADAVYIP